MNSNLVAALKPGEYLRIQLSQPVIEIGSYARSSKDSFNNKYKCNCEAYSVTQSTEPLSVIIRPDIFVGASIKELKARKAQKYLMKYRRVKPGPRQPGQPSKPDTGQ